MDKIADMIAAASKQIAALTAQYGPDALALVGRVYQLHAISDLAIFPAALIIVGLGSWVWVYGWRKTETDRGTGKWAQDDCSLLVLLGAILSVGGTLVALVAFAVATLDATIWAAALDPKMALAVHIVDMATK